MIRMARWRTGPAETSSYCATVASETPVKSCIVQMIRAGLKFVSCKDQTAGAADLKMIPGD